MIHKIQVRRSGVVIAVIQPKIWSEAIGNFNPIFCKYRGKRHLVQSDMGDISDPFRRDESYLKTMYIDL
jgi:hypothetical protein